MAKKKNENISEVVETAEPKFSIDELVKSDEFTSIEKDFLKAFVIEDCTVTEAKKLLDKKMKEAVK